MPTAVLHLVREAKYLVVRFEPIGFLESLVHKVEHDRDAKLPEGLYAFAESDMSKGPKGVALRLYKDASGVDCTPVLVAADFLREQGWDVILPEWVR